MKHLTTCITLLFCLALFITSCSKDEQNDVAKYPVDFILYLNQPSNVALNAVGGWLYVAAGTKGIIIYRNSPDQFTALERNCTFDPNASCSIVEVISGISAIDSCCTSRFSIFDGSVINGPATQPLYRYRTQYDGVALRVYN
jgi:nitrite reductase/ring-hydroxylating ferredoxin subunit